MLANFGNDGCAIGDTPGRRPCVFGSVVRWRASHTALDGGLSNSLAARKQLFEDVESWKPRLIVAHFPDWTREVSELALEVVRRQRAGGRDLLLATILVGCDNDGSGQTVEWERTARSECLAGISFLLAPRRTVGTPREKSFLCSRRGTYIRTHLDPDKNLIRRYQVGFK